MYNTILSKTVNELIIFESPLDFNYQIKHKIFIWDNIAGIYHNYSQYTHKIINYNITIIFGSFGVFVQSQSFNDRNKNWKNVTTWAQSRRRKKWRLLLLTLQREFIGLRRVYGCEN